MGLENTIIHREEVLTKFNGYTSTAIGSITLDVRTPPVVSKQAFIIVRDPSPYNGILGRSWLVKLSAESKKKSFTTVRATEFEKDEPPKKIARIDSQLSPKEKEELTAFFTENCDVFAWSPSDIPDIDSKIAYHKLHVDTAAKSDIEKRRHFVLERVAIIEVEMDKLLEPEFIEEVAHSAWLANVVLVTKKEKGK
ncbi:uncharacterized protein [Pyrus communis]|uniref:uncharacterized protein n=1 Tax=Pyrus communis TaxID=23211 RepID=UPI0035BF8E6A